MLRRELPQATCSWKWPASFPGFITFRWSTLPDCLLAAVVLQGVLEYQRLLSLSQCWPYLQIWDCTLTLKCCMWLVWGSLRLAPIIAGPIVWTIGTSHVHRHCFSMHIYMYESWYCSCSLNEPSELPEWAYGITVQLGNTATVKDFGTFDKHMDELKDRSSYSNHSYVPQTIWLG